MGQARSTLFLGDSGQRQEAVRAASEAEEAVAWLAGPWFAVR